MMIVITALKIAMTVLDLILVILANRTKDDENTPSMVVALFFIMNILMMWA